MELHKDLKPGTAERLNVIVEIPKGSINKYEFHKKTGLLKLDRVLLGSNAYPCDYGFVPNTLWHDGDPLDVAIIAREKLPPGVLVEVRAVGVIHMTDDGDSDAKIIGVPCEDKYYVNVRDINDLNQSDIDRLVHFFETYKLLDKKEVKIHGTDGVEKAKEVFQESLNLYNKQ